MAMKRLTDAAWMLLQRLTQQSAEVLYVIDTGRFYFVLHADRQDVVKETTLDSLIRAGFVTRRPGGDVPCYAINERGRAILSSRSPAWVDDTADPTPDPTPKSSARVTARPDWRGLVRKAFVKKVEQRRSQTHCKRGHAFTPDNTRTYRGTRHCRACEKDKRAQARGRLSQSTVDAITNSDTGKRWLSVITSSDKQSVTELNVKCPKCCAKPGELCMDLRYAARCSALQFHPERSAIVGGA